MVARAQVRDALQARNAGCAVLELSLLVPGWPCRGEPFQQVFLQGLAAVEASLAALALEQRADDAGYWALLIAPCDGRCAKRAALILEEAAPWCRLLDIDCFQGPEPITRASLGLPERPCLLCGAAWSRCAEHGAHSLSSLRREAELLALGVTPLQPAPGRGLRPTPARP